MDKEEKKLEDYMDFRWVAKIAKWIQYYGYENKNPEQLAGLFYSRWNNGMFSGQVPEEVKKDADIVGLVQIEWIAHIIYALKMIGWDADRLVKLKDKLLGYFGIEYDEEEKKEEREEFQDS